MNDSLNKEQKLALALLAAARTSRKTIRVLNLIRLRVDADDKELEGAINELLDQHDAQLMALEEFIRG